MTLVGTITLTLDADVGDTRIVLRREYATYDGRFETDVRAMLTDGASVLLDKFNDLPKVAP